MKILFFVFLFNLNNLFASESKKLQEEFNLIVQNSYKSVVSVRVEKEETASVLEPEFFFGYVIPDEKIYKYKIGGVGSGVIVDERGFVITNFHVISDMDKIKVKVKINEKEEKTYDAEFIGGDRDMDIAIIKIKSKEKFPCLRFSQGETKIGDIVLAIGYPFGFSQTITQGIVSGLNASLKVEGRIYNSLIQTDAAINQGNSGGPLLNLDGEIAGINTAIMSPSGAFSGLGFAISAKEVKAVFDEVVYGKKRQKAWLGVYLLPVSQISDVYNFSIPEGGIINKVVKGSPAYKAGLSRGDVITSIDGKEIKDEKDLYYSIYWKKPGDEVEIEYFNKGNKKNIKLSLGIRPEENEIEKSDNVKYDENEKQVQDMDSFKWKGIKFKRDGNNILISSISMDSPLKNYLKTDDIIKGVNNSKIDNLYQLKNTLDKINISDGVLFDIVRNDEPLYLSIKINQ
jgi:S1-C subfamily serine protease